MYVVHVQNKIANKNESRLLQSVRDILIPSTLPEKSACPHVEHSLDSSH